jgi:hypothetical protein
VFDISKCKFGVPIVISLPHFLHADPFYLTTLYGLSPNESKHNFYADVDSTTGTTVGLRARAQINVAINKAPGFRYRNIPNIVWPVLWTEYQGDATPDIEEQLWLAAHLPQIMTTVSSYSLFSVGGLLILGSVLLLSCRLLKRKDIKISKDPMSKRDSQDDNSNILRRQTSGSSASDLGIDNPAPIV